MALILDTSVLLAALDASDRDYWCHERLTPEAWLAFFTVFAGAYSVENPMHGDLDRCHELQGIYADPRLDVVDASPLALAERLNEPKLATLDHRHFATVRPRHVEALALLPG